MMGTMETTEMRATANHMVELRPFQRTFIRHGDGTRNRHGSPKPPTW